MQLTRFSDLGLRVLMYLVGHDDTPRATVGEIAEQFDVPANHLHKVVHRMGSLGWVETARGRTGGIRLSADPAKLHLGDVVRALEETTELIDCTEPPCALGVRCALKGVLDAGLAAFYDKLNEHTLADMAVGRTGAALVKLRRSYHAARG